MSSQTGLRIAIGGTALGFAGRGGGASAPWFVAATRGENPLAIASANGASKQRFIGRTRHITSVDLKSIKGGWCGWYSNVSGVDTNCGNDLGVEVSFEIIGAPTPVVRQKFGGSNIGTMVNGTDLYLGDSIPASAFGLSFIPAGTIIWSKTRFYAASNSDFYPFTVSNNVTGEGAFLETTAVASQVMNPGVLVLQAGCLSQGAQPGPRCILGQSVSGLPITSVDIVGDSIAYDMGGSQYDTNGDGDPAFGGGVSRRAAFNINGAGKVMPWVMSARPGDTANAFVTGNNSIKRRAIWPYVTNLYNEYGTNDGITGRSPAQVLASNQLIGQWAKAAGVKHVTNGKVIPRGSSSLDGWTSIGGQTIQPTFVNVTGTFRQPYNALLDADAGQGHGIDEVIDLSPGFADATQTDHIRVDVVATTDGVHPQPAAAAPMAALLAPIMNGW